MVTSLQKVSIYLLTPFTTPRQCFVFALVVIGVAGVAQLFYPQFPHPLSPDSFSYMEFRTFRNALYPAFLDLFGGDFLYTFQPKLDRIFTIQITIYIVAMGFMLGGLAIARLPISVLLVFLLALTSNYQLHLYHRIILTESLGLSLLCVLIGCLALWFHTKSSRRYGWLALAMLVATMGFGLRPNMVAMPIGVAIVAMFHLIHTRHWQKTLAAIVLPFLLVAGFESAYYHAHHGTRSHELLQRHMFGKAALVLAIHEEAGQSDEFYEGEFADLKPFMARFGGLFRADRDRYLASGEDCVRFTIHTLYEDAVYWHFASPPDSDWTRRVFATYPATTARVIAQHYLHFFCVATPATAKTPIIANEIMRWQPHDSPTPRKRFFLQLIAYAFIALGIAFFTAKFYYGYRWVRRGMAFLSSRFTSPPLTPLESLDSTCIMLAFGYNLFISIFSVSVTRFLIISYPLIVLGILLMLVLIAQHFLLKKNL